MKTVFFYQDEKDGNYGDYTSGYSVEGVIKYSLGDKFHFEDIADAPKGDFVATAITFDYSSLGLSQCVFIEKIEIDDVGCKIDYCEKRRR